MPKLKALSHFLGAQQAVSKKKSTNEEHRVYYDPGVDALYIAIKGGPESEVREVATGVNTELNRKKEIIGFEILNAANSSNLS